MFKVTHTQKIHMSDELLLGTLVKPKDILAGGLVWQHAWHIGIVCKQFNTAPDLHGRCFPRLQILAVDETGSSFVMLNMFIGYVENV